MTYNKYIWFDDELNKETEDAVYFFNVLCPLDNFSAYSVEIWGQRFPTAEHAYQSKKFADSAPEVARRIASAATSHEAKDISRAEALRIAPGWLEKRAALMREVVRAKFAQNEEVREALRATGSRTIIENSHEDSFGGIGEGEGENTMGKIWMGLRNEFFPIP